MKDMIEHDYWDLIRGGNNEAFSKLYNEHANMLYRYGMKIVQDSVLVEDAIQTVFLNIFERRRFISQPKSIGAYLYMSLRNAILCEIRKDKLSIVPLEEEFDSKNRLIDYDFRLEIDPCSLLEMNEEEGNRQKVLQQILDSLDGKQRELIYLRFYKGLSVDEVACLFNTNNHQINKAVSRIIKKLREKNICSKTLNTLVLSMLNLL